MDAQVDAQSDLIPGVYEGGLKTWECALDLVETLDGLHSGRWSEHFSGKYILELGCGTALPSLFMLTQVLNDRAGVGMTLNLADYNAQVLQLVTLPNVLLAWWSSAAAAAFRAGAGAQQTALERHELARRGQDHFDTAPHDVDGHGELAITPELVSAFRTSLAAHGVQVNFVAGAWTNFPPPARGMDLILTSETVYALPSLSPLVRLLHTYAAADAAVLVAAKVIYFGVGGGVEAFKQTLAQLAPSAQVASIHTVTRGVGRTVLSVTF
jgi:protein-histidine N-methyltransferase